MATATITELAVTLNEMNNINPGNITATHANASANETVIQLQGSGCAATGYAGNPPASITPPPTEAQISASMTGTITAFDGTNRHVSIWVRTLYPVFTRAQGGVMVVMQATGTARIYFDITGSPEYQGSWRLAVVNVNGGATPDVTPILTFGSPNLTNISAIGAGFAISESKGEDFLQNQYFDIARRTDANGDFGGRISGGTSGDRLVLNNLVVDDTNFLGVLQGSGVLFTMGMQCFLGGTGLTTYLQDSDKIVQFLDNPVASNFYKIVGTTGTITDIDLQAITWLGLSDRKFLFDMSGLATGDSGIFDSSTFINASTITFNAFCSADQCAFTTCNTIVPGGITLLTPIFTNCGAVTLTATNDLIDGGETRLHNTAINVPFVTTNDLAKIQDHSFDNTGGTGHAIEITAAGTYSFVGNTFTGYGGTPGSNLTPASGDSSAAIYNNSGGLVTINITGGGALPSVRNGAGATTVCNLSVPVTVTVQDTAGNPIQGAKVFLETTPGGVDIFTYGITNASGQVSTSYGGSTPQAVVGYVAKGTASPVYKRANINDTISATGLAATVTMVLDE